MRILCDRSTTSRKRCEELRQHAMLEGPMSWYSIPTSFGCFQTQTQSMRRCGRSGASSGGSRGPKVAGAQHLPQPDRDEWGSGMLSTRLTDFRIFCRKIWVMAQVETPSCPAISTRGILHSSASLEAKSYRIPGITPVDSPPAIFSRKSFLS